LRSPAGTVKAGDASGPLSKNSPLGPVESLTLYCVTGTRGVAGSASASKRTGSQVIVGVVDAELNRTFCASGMTRGLSRTCVTACAVSPWLFVTVMSQAPVWPAYGGPLE